jgi:hypothetical protein
MAKWHRHAGCNTTSLRFEPRSILGDTRVNLYIWLPAMLLFGLAMIGLMFAFVIGCAKI